METEKFIKPEWHEVIIAMKGLPCTGKTEVAEQICKWAECPLLCIDEFIGAPNNNTTADSWEEAERLQLTVLERAFTTLCRVADRQLKANKSCVVIKSRLSSPFELQQLFTVLFDRWGFGRKLLIVECRVRNKHRWQNSFNHDEYEKKWYRPRRWSDIEKAIDDHFDPQSLSNWDLHLQLLTQQHPEILVRRLMVDPHYDLGLASIFQPSINPIFAQAINHLLKLNDQNPYGVKFDEFRRSRAREIALASPKRSKHLCGVDGCLFQYREKLQVEEDDGSCGVCEEKLASGQPGYTCHYCILTLHKSCAELIEAFDPHSITSEYRYLYYYEFSENRKHACGSHLQEGFSGNCESCIFQSVLKGRMLPAVVNHYDHHPHPLSLSIQDKVFICNACRVDEYCCSYVCKSCEWYYHIQCIFMPREWKHGHGGHEHVLELKYSHDDTEQEDYWCNVCFKDLDPYYWYYSCSSCPYYAAHLYCAGVYPTKEASDLWRYA